MSSGFDINSWVERLTEELIKDFIMDALDIWMRKGEEGILKEGNQHSDTVKKKDDTASNKLCFIEQWQDTLCSADSGKVQVQPHDPDIVYRLVDAAVEKLMGLANSATIYIPEAPSYIIDEESVKAYGRIMYEFISEILHEVLADHFGITRSMWQTENILSSLQSSRISLTDLKVAVKSEMQKELNLEQTDLQMKERFLTLCKYRSAKRDRVDYILTQELHREELQWVDYSDDQITVKMKLTEEIFHFLLDDTISILKHICMTPFF
ncbi:centrosome-associated protein 350 [Esox lucius]|uniref:centrosome-associated protein 350 n=1 Tax=Esox lucius TaxID=8010 RepID=UPI001476C82A|nr:centrosome-associated protein 350 [Esox lucius]